MIWRWAVIEVLLLLRLREASATHWMHGRWRWRGSTVPSHMHVHVHWRWWPWSWPSSWRSRHLLLLRWSSAASPHHRWTSSSRWKSITHRSHRTTPSLGRPTVLHGWSPTLHRRPAALHGPSSARKSPLHGCTKGSHWSSTASSSHWRPSSHHLTPAVGPGVPRSMVHCLYISY